MEIKLNCHVDGKVTEKIICKKNLPLDEYPDAMNVN